MTDKKKRKYCFTRSIYVSEDDEGIDKQVNILAKKDMNIPEEIRKKKSSLVSFITVGLWKKYIYDQTHKGDEE